MEYRRDGVYLLEEDGVAHVKGQNLQEHGKFSQGASFFRYYQI